MVFGRMRGHLSGHINSSRCGQMLSRGSLEWNSEVESAIGEKKMFHNLQLQNNDCHTYERF